LPSRRWRFGLLEITALLLALIPFQALAEAVPVGSIAGTVVDDRGPIPGALVSLTGEGLLAPRGSVTDVQGNYQFGGVPAGEYVVTVTFAGGKPIRSAPFKVRDGGITQVPPVSVFVEKVTVEATAEKVIEAGKTTVGETFSSEKIAQIPTGRSYTDVVQLAAGVSQNDGTGGIAAYGSTGLESNYLIDGINTTSVGSGKPGAQLHFDIIKEIEVKTGGYEAEFGGAQGAVVNVLTKTGGNEFSGSLNFLKTPDTLASEPQVNGFGTQVPTPDDQEIAASLGGYLIKDKLFFYSGYSRQNDSRTAPQRFENTFARQEAQDTEDRKLYFLKTTWQMAASRRLVASVWSDPDEQNLRDELGGFGGDHRVRSGGNDGSLLYQDILAGGRWIVEGQIGFHTESDDVSPTLDQEEFNPIRADRRHSVPSVRARCRDITDVYCLGSDEGLSSSTSFGEPSLRFGPYAYSGRTSGRRNDRSLTAEGVFTRHDIKGGIGFEGTDFSQDLDYGYGTGMALEWLPVTSPASGSLAPPVSIMGVRRCWGDGQGNCRQWNDQVQAEGGTKGTSLFLQDRWTPVPSVTLNYGLRWETQFILDSTGQEVGRIRGSLAPRLGATWDTTGDGKTKLYASWGRYYDSIPMQVVSRAFSPRITSTRLYRSQEWTMQGFWNDIRSNGICAVNSPKFDRASAFAPTCWDFESADFVDDPNRSAYDLVDKVHSSRGINDTARGLLYPDTIVDSGSLFRAPVDENLKGAHSDEAILGYEWEFMPRWRAGVKTIRRDLKDAIEDMSLDLGKNFIIGNPGGPYRFYVDPANTDMVNPDYVPGSSDPAQQPRFAQIAGCVPGQICELTNEDLQRIGYGGFPKATRRFRGYEMDLSGQVQDRLWLNFTYLHSTTEGNYRGRYFVESEERDPNLTEAFDVPALVVNTDGPLPQDQREQVKLYGNYRVTTSFNLGTTLRYVSGAPTSATTDPTGGSTPFFGPIFLLQRGTAGRLPSSQTVDLSFTYQIQDRGKMKMSVSLDLFNALNSQKPLAVDEQFMATGLWSGPVSNGMGGADFAPEFGSRIGRGEPLAEYVDTVFGNGDGALDPKEWNAWASSFQGRFHSLDEMYGFFRTETVTLTRNGETFDAPAYPGFAGCPASLSEALDKGCAGINPGFGQSKLLEPPRSIRLGLKLSF
jgi:carboxypeptidase family protein/TonB-dependent receptor-like protein